MSKKIILLISLFPMFLYSCKKDESEGVRLNEIIIGDEIFSPSNVLILDLGPDNTDTHYGYQFFIADADITYNRISDELSLNDNATFILTFVAGSLGSDRFEGGTFDIYPTTYVPNSSNYFVYGFFDALDDFTPKEINDGTIIINPIDAGFRFEFDLNVQGRTLTGFHMGSYDIVEI